MKKSEILQKIKETYKCNNLLVLKNVKATNNYTLSELRHLIYPNKLTLVKSSLVRLEFKKLGEYYENMYMLEIKDIQKLNFLEDNINTILIVGNYSYETTISSVIRSKSIIVGCLTKNLHKIQNYLTQI